MLLSLIAQGLSSYGHSSQKTYLKKKKKPLWESKVCKVSVEKEIKELFTQVLSFTYPELGGAELLVEGKRLLIREGGGWRSKVNA